jgi:hypothetical protein
MLPCEWSPLNECVGYTARRGDGKYAPREVDVAMRMIAIASYKKTVRCVVLSTLNLAKFCS